MKRHSDRRSGQGTVLLEMNPPAIPQPAKRSSLPSVNSGILAGLDDEGHPLVVPLGGTLPLAAKSICRIAPGDIGRELIISFENGDAGKPVILGVVQTPTPPAEVQLDGEYLTFTAKEQIVFRCGKASITLTRAGKVLIRGSYVLSRSSGANRIKGGSVQIN